MSKKAKVQYLVLPVMALVYVNIVMVPEKMNIRIMGIVEFVREQVNAKVVVEKELYKNIDMENDLQSRRGFFRKSVKLATLFVLGSASLLVRASYLSQERLGFSSVQSHRDCCGTCESFCKDSCRSCCRGTCGLACDGSCIALARSRRNKQVDSCRVDSSACKVDSCCTKNKI